MSKVGKVVVNSQGYEAIVMGIVRRTKYGNYIYKVRFIESGYVCEVDGGNLSKGRFKDYGRPTVYGVGFSYKGAKSKGRIYKTWVHMLERCYDKNFHAYSRYGGSGVKVSQEWLHFRNFERDIKELPNYEKFLNDPSYTLDKDIRGNGKLYSKDTCMFASKMEQSHAQKRVKKIKAISPTGEIFIFPSICRACDELGVQNANVYKVLKGERKHTCGFRFERVI
jgi:hypothetical protein